MYVVKLLHPKHCSSRLLFPLLVQSSITPRLVNHVSQHKNPSFTFHEDKYQQFMAYENTLYHPTQSLGAM